MGQRVIGLTGGIATGKTTVSQYLESHHGLPVLDADIFARQAVEPGSAILRAVVQRYGPSLLHDDGTLNRSQLGQLIFTDTAEKTWLEQQIHPFVRQRFAAAMADLNTEPTVVQVIPLLFEADLTTQVTEIWVVICPQAVELARLMARNDLPEAAAQARIDHQWPLATKAKRADVVLDNSSTLENLYEQVDQALLAAG
ncbi:MAG: dephospho-CoA kinase [Cyanobacteria bacterium P01_H01_bin.58]